MEKRIKTRITRNKTIKTLFWGFFHHFIVSRCSLKRFSIGSSRDTLSLLICAKKDIKIPYEQNYSTKLFSTRHSKEKINGFNGPLVPLENPINICLRTSGYWVSTCTTCSLSIFWICSIEQVGRILVRLCRSYIHWTLSAGSSANKIECYQQNKTIICFGFSYLSHLFSEFLCSARHTLGATPENWSHQKQKRHGIRKNVKCLK